ncbi:hypothetical protein DSECCO2_661370 [anaerobic digester metagenome]
MGLTHRHTGSRPVHKLLHITGVGVYLIYIGVNNQGGVVQPGERLRLTTGAPFYLQSVFLNAIRGPGHLNGRPSYGVHDLVQKIDNLVERVFHHNKVAVKGPLNRNIQIALRQLSQHARQFRRIAVDTCDRVGQRQRQSFGFVPRLFNLHSGMQIALCQR